MKGCSVFSRNDKIIKHLNTLESYLNNEYSVEVFYDVGVSDVYYPDISRIEINSRQNYRSRLHSLLHEAGHVILRSSKKSFKKNFPHMKSEGSFSRGNINHRIDILREEVLAWEEAEALAKYLDIKLNKKVWSRHRNEALKTYVKWI